MKCTQKLLWIFLSTLLINLEEIVLCIKYSDVVIFPPYYSGFGKAIRMATTNFITKKNAPIVKNLNKHLTPFDRCLIRILNYQNADFTQLSVPLLIQQPYFRKDNGFYITLKKFTKYQAFNDSSDCLSKFYSYCLVLRRTFVHFILVEFVSFPFTIRIILNMYILRETFSSCTCKP